MGGSGNVYYQAGSCGNNYKNMQSSVVKEKTIGNLVSYSFVDIINNGGSAWRKDTIGYNSGYPILSGIDYGLVTSYTGMPMPVILLYDIVVLDASTIHPVEGVQIFDKNTNEMLGTTNMKGSFTYGASAITLASDALIVFRKSGYNDFVCYYKDLDADAYMEHPVNYVHMVPNGETNYENAGNLAFVNEHIYFAENKYSNFLSQYGFYDLVWSYDKGNEMWAANTWEVLGDLGEIATLSFDDLIIQKDYYDLYIADLILEFTGNDFENILQTKAIDAYEDTYKLVRDNIIRKIYNIIDEGEELEYQRLLEDLDVRKKICDEEWFTKELDKVLQGKSNDVDAVAKKIYEKFFSKLYVDEELYNSIYVGACQAEEFSSLIKDTFELANSVTTAYILACSCCAIHQEYYNILFEAAQEMEKENFKYATRFIISLEPYYALTTDRISMMKFIKDEYRSDLINFIYKYTIKDLIKNITYKGVAEKLLGIEMPQLKLLVATYTGTYKLMDKITKNSKKAEQYAIMNYVSYVEKSLETVISKKAKNLISEKSYKTAVSYDNTYTLLRYTNKYLYECLYQFAVLTKEEIGIEVAMINKNMWNLSLCHGGKTICDRSKYISISCPVNVYLYDEAENLILSIVNEEIVECNDSLVTAEVSGGEKAIIYPAEKDYSIEIVAYSNGKMNYSVVEIDNINPVRNVDFYDISLFSKQSYTGKIPAIFHSDNNIYTLHTNGNAILCDYDSDVATNCDQKGHFYGEWVVTIEPTINEFGMQKRVCKTCCKVEMTSIKPLKDTNNSEHLPSTLTNDNTKCHMTVFLILIILTIYNCKIKKYRQN